MVGVTLFIKTICFCLLFSFAHGQSIYSDRPAVEKTVQPIQGYYGMAQRVFIRILYIMHQYTVASRNLMKTVNHIRFLHEESPEYEMGYVLAEIIEKYRKIVSMSDWGIRSFQDNLMNSLKIMELGQKLWMDMYHLVNMMHEIPFKYKADSKTKEAIANEYISEESFLDNTEVENAIKKEAEAKEKKIKHMEERGKRLKRLRKEKFQALLQQDIKERELGKVVSSGQEAIYAKYKETTKRQAITPNPKMPYWLNHYGWEMSYEL